jgi:DNA-binding MarR family transcriptional regulator
MSRSVLPAPDPGDAVGSVGSVATAGRERAAVAAVADNLVRFARAFGRAKARMLAAASRDVEGSAHIILKHLQHEGPMRAGTVAETLHSDPSTVSRQVAALVKDGLLERRSDPQDGRASLLVLTDPGRALLADHDRLRLDYFAYLLDDWTDDEIRDFAAKLDRFNSAYEAVDHDWIRERFADRAARPRSST